MGRKVSYFSFLILLLCSSAFAAQRTDRLDLINGTTSVGKLRLYEDGDDGSNNTIIQPQAQSDDIVLVLPADDGDPNQFLTTDGSGVLDWVTGSSATDLVCADCVTLTTETTGDYVKSLVAGTAIDVTAASEGVDNTVDFDSTELGTTTFGSGSGIVWTFNASAGTDPTITFGDSSVIISHPVVSSGSGSSIIFEGATADNFETTLTVVDPTTPDKTITLQDKTGTVALTDSETFTTSLALPQGTGPTVDAAGEIAVDTTDGQLIYYGTAKRVISYKLQKNLSYDSPTSSDLIHFWKPADNITITSINCIVDPAGAGESAVIDIQECDSNGDSCASVDAAITCANTNTADDGSLSNPTIDAGDWVVLDGGTVTGTVTNVGVEIRYTLDAE